MLMGNFLKDRKSVRNFKAEKVEFEKLEDIRQEIKFLNNEEGKEGFSFRLYENGELIREALSGKGGYSGVMIDAPHYIALDFLDDYDSTLIYGAYNMERLISQINEKGLATCWISIGNLNPDFKKEIFGESTNNIEYILAFGYEKAPFPLNEEPFSVKKGMEDFVFSEKLERELDTGKLEASGLKDLFYHIGFVPSTRNLQPWRFILKDTTVELLLAYKDWDQHFLVDAGVMMYYFEQLAKAAAINNKWHLIDGNIYETDKYNYKSIGVFNL